MSKIWLEPASVVDGHFLGEGQPPLVPGLDNVRQVFLSVERFIEYMKPAVGDTFAFLSLHDYRIAEEKSPMYGSVNLVGGFRSLFHDYLIITDDGWSWLNDGDLPGKIRREEEAARLEEERKIREAYVEGVIANDPWLKTIDKKVAAFFVE